MLADLPGAVFGDIAIRLFQVERDGVFFGLVDASHEERGGDSAELYPQRMGFFPPFNGLYDT
jgi:formate hydrogenlyase regulatory protein HycA